MTRRDRPAILRLLRPMALTLRTPRKLAAALSLTTARFDLRPATMSLVAGAFAAPRVGPLRGSVVADTADGALPGGADGWLLPAVVALVALAGMALLGMMIRRGRQPPAASPADESEDASPGTLGVEAGRDRNLPRWLDPSIAAARFRTDPTASVRAVSAIVAAPNRTPLVFAEPIDDLVERAQVRYDGVPLLDRPDDVLGQTQRELDADDEVEVLERSEIWARIRTPNGASGWLPSMTLVVPVTVPPPLTDDVPVAADPPPQASPLPMDAPPELESILAAILAQRQSRPEPRDRTAETATVSVEVDPVAPLEQVAPKRNRVRRPRAERPAKAQADGTDPIATTVVEPAPVSQAAPAVAASPTPPAGEAEPVTAPAPKRRRARTSAGARQAARLS